MNTPYWFSNLAYWSAQVAVLALAAGFLPQLFRIRQPRVLLVYWRALIAICLLLPFAQPWHRAEILGTINFAPRIGEFAPFVTATPAPAAHWHLPSAQIISESFGLVLLAGIAARFTILALGLLKLRQFRRASTPISNHTASSAVLDEMRLRVNTGGEFRISSDVDSPVTFGLSAPVILLPERFPTLDAQHQSAIACHELLHVRRRDWAHHLCEEILRAALWFHPAIAWLIARIRLSREQVVDLEVVRLTDARKPYLEALLEFTNSRALAAAIPAPPFLIERQLAERVALMLKEVRMSRTRLIASMAAIATCLALVATLAVWTFPLKAAPRAAQNPPQGGVVQGVPGGITDGVTIGVLGGVPGGVIGGVTGGVPGGITSNAPAQSVKGGVRAGIVSGVPISGPTQRVQSAPKIVVADIKFEGEVHDAGAVRARILKGMEGHVWDGSNNEWLDVIAEVGVRGDYQNHGYFEVVIDGAKSQVLDSNGGQQRVLATFNVKEGDRFTTGDITFVNANPETPLAITETELRQQIQLSKGDWISVGQFRTGITRMVGLFVERGYKYTTVDPNFSIDRANHSISATFTVHQARTNPKEKPELPAGNPEGRNAAVTISPASEPQSNGGQIARAGQNGVTMPVCEYCPRPEYSPEAREANIQGTVYLQIVVLTTGRAGEIKVIKGFAKSLDEQATKVVRKKWTLKPTTHRNGDPVDVLVPVEIAFQLLGPPQPIPPSTGRSAAASPATTPLTANESLQTKIFTGPLTDDGKSTPFYMGIVNTQTLYAPNPELPSLARRANVKGSVTLNIIVNSEGKVIVVEYVKGPAMLVQEAIKTVRDWIIKGTHDGVPVTFQISVEVSFQTN
jgi:TonB family protein